MGLLLGKCQGIISKILIIFAKKLNLIATNLFVSFCDTRVIYLDNMYQLDKLARKSLITSLIVLHEITVNNEFWDTICA